MIELRRVKDGESLLDLICSDFLGRTSDGVSSELISALGDGNFVVFLDGYDELSPSVRKVVSEEISEITAEFQYCNFVLTSRPDPALASFSGYTRYDVADLSKDEAFSLLRRYDDGRKVAESLISKISSMPAVDEFLKVPLLVTLLYKAFDYKAVVPIKKNIFYRQVFDALYQDHDLSKEGAFERRKRSSLDLEEFHRFMRNLGFISFKRGVVQYSQEDFSMLVEQALKQSGLKADASGLRVDLISAVPLFVRESNEYRWSHKSFQDYFSAQFIYFDAGADRDELIRRMFFGENVQRYSGLLSLLFEIDHGLISDLCILPFLQSCCTGDGSSVFESGELDLQYKFLSAISDVFLDQTGRVGPEEDDRYFERYEQPSHDMQGPSKRRWRRILRSGSEKEVLVAMSSDGIHRAELIGSMVGHRRPSRRVKEYIESVRSLNSDSEIINLAIFIKNCSESSESMAALRLMGMVANTWSPTVDFYSELRAAAATRRDMKASLSIFEGFD